MIRREILFSYLSLGLLASLIGLGISCKETNPVEIEEFYMDSPITDKLLATLISPLKVQGVGFEPTNLYRIGS